MASYYFVFDGVLTMLEAWQEELLMNSMEGWHGKDKKGHFSVVKNIVFQ
jgi:hypothetical protein